MGHPTPLGLHGVHTTIGRTTKKRANMGSALSMNIEKLSAKCSDSRMAPTRKKGFVIPTKSFVKIGITKIFCYNNKMFGKRLVAAAKFLVAATKILFVVSNFCCRNKTIFFCVT